MIYGIFVQERYPRYTAFLLFQSNFLEDIITFQMYDKKIWRW